MARIEFENGQTVEFEGEPTPQDVEEVAKSLGIGQQPQTPPASTAQKVQKAADFVPNLAVGVVKGLGSTLAGASSLGERYLLRPIDKLMGIETEGPTQGQQIQEQLLQPKGTAQKIGFGAEQIAEFLIPSSKIAKAEKGLSLFPRMATEAGIVGGQTAIQEGDVDNKTKTSALIGAMFPFAGAVLSKTKGLVKPVGEKIQTTVIRPGVRDLEDGFNLANVNKYKLGGSLSETAVKTHTKMNELVSELNSKLGAGKNKVNLNDVFQATSNALQGDRAKAFGDIGATQRVLESLKSEIKEVAGDGGAVNLIDATNIKRGAGTKGAWAYGRVEPDAGAVEKVYSTFYNKIKTAIEQNSPPGVKEINRQLSEIIPISNAVLRRLPVEQRNNVINLTDSIGLFSAIFDPRALALIGASKLSKSGKFGAWLTKVGSKKPATTGIGQRIFGN